MRPTPLQQRFTPTPLALAAAIAIALAADHAPSAHAQSGSITAAAPMTINIPAQPLGQALNELARQANLQMSFPAALVAGKTAPTVSGTLTTQQALDRLLAGSGLIARQDGASVVVNAPPSRSTDSAQTLAPINVIANVDIPLALQQERGYRSQRSAVSGFRAQDVLDTPFSVATFSAEVIEDQQAKSLADVIRNDPSISLAGDPHWFERVNVRGFNLSTNAVYRDGLSINDQGSIALENKAAIEVNKGLSALRYGATSPGGTINYVVKRPTLEPLRMVGLNANDDGGVGVRADLSGRFGKDAQFGYRINAAAEELRSYVKPFKGDKQFVSGFFDWQISDRLTLELDLEHQRLDKLSLRGPFLWWWGWGEDGAAVAAAQAAFDRLGPDTYATQKWAMEPNEQTYIVARASYQINDEWKIRLAAHRSELWRDQNSSSVWDVVSPNGDYEADIFYSPDQERNNTAYQLVFEGDVTHGSMRHELAFGYDQVQRDMTFPDGVYDSIGFDNIFNPVGMPRPGVGPADAGPSYLANRSRQRSFFVTDNFTINEHWGVFSGLRHTTIQQFSGGSATQRPSKSYDQSVVNPTFGLIYKPTPTSTLYISYAEGIEQGGVVGLGGATPYTNARAQLPPLESRQYEAGWKWELNSETMLTAAVFEIDKGLEIDRNNGNGTRTRVQDGRQVHRGVEFTAGGQLSPNLRMIAGVAYIDAKIEKTSNAALRGKTPQGIPEWQANLYADYSLNAWIPGLSVNGGVYYGGRKSIDPGNLWFADSYVRLDGGIKYVQRFAGGQQATYRLSIENLTDKRYLSNTTFGALQFGAPRTVRLSANLSF